MSSKKSNKRAASDAPALTIPVPAGPIPVLPNKEPKATVELTIDGQDVSIPEGATLLDAAREIGIDTPTLCYLENLTPVNVCRICVMELEGGPNLGAGLLEKGRSRNGSPDEFRACALESPHGAGVFASSVDVSTAPELQGYMQEYDAKPERYGAVAAPAEEGARESARPGVHCTPEGITASTVHQPTKVDNDLYVRDYSKCILCYKCVEACGVDAQNTFAIAVAGRGFDARISTEYSVPLPESACVYCGNCIGVCPTGALMFRSEHDMRQAGTWDESKQAETDTICPFCGVGCTVTLHTQDNQIVKATSPLDQEVTRGHLCIKGRFGWQFVQVQDSDG